MNFLYNEFEVAYKTAKRRTQLNNKNSTNYFYNILNIYF